MNCLGMDCRWVVYGLMGGIKVDQANFTKFWLKRASIIASALRSRSDEYKSRLVSDFQRDCLKGFDDGDFKPVIDR